MSAVKDGGSAFPMQVLVSPGSQIIYGMSMRDYFAAKAMPFVAGRADIDHTGAGEWAAACYEIADAMLRAREAKP